MGVEIADSACKARSLCHRSQLTSNTGLSSFLFLFDGFHRTNCSLSWSVSPQESPACAHYPLLHELALNSAPLDEGVCSAGLSSRAGCWRGAMLSASKELESAHIQSSVQQTFASHVGHTRILCAQTYWRPTGDLLQRGKVFRARTVQTKRQVVCCRQNNAPLPHSFLVETSEPSGRNRREVGLFAWRRECP